LTSGVGSGSKTRSSGRQSTRCAGSTSSLTPAANALSSFDDARAASVRRACERYEVHLGLHTSSAVNVAEMAPYVGDAVERYLEAYVEIAPRIGAEWIVMHAGFHFTPTKRGGWPSVSIY
jgi:sugar phosphate isomerase/epimerase